MADNLKTIIRKNKIFLVFMLSFISIGWLLYICFGHQLIRLMYEGRATGILNRIIKGQAMHPVEGYFEKADMVFLMSNILFLFSTVFIFILFTEFKNICLFLKQELLISQVRKSLKNFSQIIRVQKKTILLCAAIFISFYILYSTMAFFFVKSTAFSESDVLFEIDTPRVIDDIAVFSANHYRTEVHPLYVILVNPIGSFLKYLIDSKVMAAVFINSFFGAAGVVLAFVFFWLYSRNYTTSLLLSSFFGLSMSQLFLSVVPATSSLATCALIFSYILLVVTLQTKQPYFIIWALAGIFSLGTTTTNFIQTLICFGVATAALPKNEKETISYTSRIIGVASLVVILTIFISIIQKAIYPSSKLFFLPHAFIGDFRYASLLIAKQPLKVIAQIIKHFFLVNIIAPLPAVFTMHNRLNPAITFATSWSYTGIGCFGTVLWLCLLIGSIAKNVFSKWKYHSFFLAMFLCLVFNIILHIFYGIGENDKIELFLYSGNFTFIVLSFLCTYTMSRKLFIKAALAVLGILTGVNNLVVMNRILALYRQ